MSNDVDPFAPVESTPSVSFNPEKVGKAPITYKLEVLRPAEIVESRGDDGQVERWDDGNPKLKIAIRTKVLDGPEAVGEERGLWMPKSFAKEGGMARSIRDAVAAAGATSVAAGGVLEVTWYDTEPAKSKTFSGRKLYKAVYTPPNAFAGDDEAPF